MILKPHEQEGRITLTERQRAKKRRELYNHQLGMCAECHLSMIWVQGFMNTATLDYIVPQPAGAKKRDNDDNLRVICWSCNAKKGSRRCVLT